ncbi:hypothetical protein BCR37DRAFT_251096 [Protomyces lactucae-debilis]|uniref:Uncharacterized protein n=1 Tax=Protomyces lactucae-debilis TaxID=2754530 RepID=A0A1Y2FLG3_PROLT|nr:uncharacterized protein BCR37DRAFT_251096 [Protomyces lactucae-debilis]ORY84769.1 hypothetical protein BCR37DRAFT_251096 [Protomyces lactucae-debilis]
MPKFLIPVMLEYSPSATWLRRPNAIFTTKTDLSCDELTTDERNCGCQKALGRDDREGEASTALPHPFDLNQPAPGSNQSDLDFAAHFDRVRESTATTQQLETQFRTALHPGNDPNGQQDYPYNRGSLQSMQQYAPQTGSDSPYGPAAHFNSHVGYNSAPGQHSSGYGDDPQTSYQEYSYQGQNSGRDDNPNQDVLPDLDAAFNSDHRQSPDCYRGPDGGVNCAFE